MRWWAASKLGLTQSPAVSGTCEEEVEEALSSGTHLSNFWLKISNVHYY